MLATDTETVLASMATSWSFRPGALGNSIAGSFFDEYMLGAVAQQGCCGVFGCTESDEEPLNRCNSRAIGAVCFDSAFAAKLYCRLH